MKPCAKSPGVCGPGSVKRDRFRRITAFWAMLALIGTGDAIAQSVDCTRLQAQIAAAGRGGSAQAGRFAAEAARQQAEINRTAAHAASIGCNNRQFLFFGSAPPPQCAGINARLAQMRAQVAALNSQAHAASNDIHRRDLQARYDSYCRGGGRSLFDTLFDRGDRFDDRVQIPVGPDRGGPREIEEDDFERGSRGSMAVCVRTCDGGFFPVSYSARRANLDELEDACRALCPNAEVRLFTYQPSKDIDSAVSIDGDSYSSLRNAGKFRTRYDPTCGCKPANKTWAEALANAEELLTRRKSDIIVTQEKSDELLRGGRGAGSRATAPTTPGGATGGRTFGLADGVRKEQETPDGARKRVRVIDPNQ